MNPDRQSNRAWLLTAPGSAAIAVVRIAGPGVDDFLGAHFSRAVSPGSTAHGNLSDAGKVIDDPVIMRLENGAADVCVHGGTWIVQATQELLKRAGFAVSPSPCTQGEGWGEGAFFNFKSQIANAKDPSPNPLPEYRERGIVDDVLLDGGETEIEREMLAHLPMAQTELAVRMLLRQPAAWANFAKNGPQARRFNAEKILADRSLWWLLHPPRVAIVGVANAGKSTLANQLFATQRSITADLPGTTRDWIGETANIDGLAITLIDTPGLRETSDAIERAAIAASAAPIASADLVIIVLDASKPLDEDQARLLRRWPEALVVANKRDLTQDFEFEISDERMIACDSLHGVGVDKVRAAIRQRFLSDPENPDKPRWWTQRQHDWLES